MEFKIFRDEMRSHFDKMIKNARNLFVVEINRDKIWEVYLNSFPEADGVRQSYNCNTCKSFLRQWGSLVAINDDYSITTLWDFTPSNDLFEPVVKNMSEYIKSNVISDLFINTLSRVGVEKNRCTLPSGEVIYWNHFYLDIPSKFKREIPSSTTEDSVRALARGKKEALLNSLTNISESSLDIVSDLINQGNLYRGDEYKSMLLSFRKVLSEFNNLPDDKKDAFAWIKSVDTSDSVARLRGTSIGQLLEDITSGVDIESAVTSYERKIAPENYKRPKAIVTKRMIEDAQKTISELGLEDSLPRRHATLEDVTVNNVIYVDRNTRSKMEGLSGIFEEMKNEVLVNPKSVSKNITEIGIQDFIDKVLPSASNGVEVLLENKHLGNLMTLTSPVNKEAKPLFKWSNGFSWSYRGDMTDSIKEKVKAAGGNINAVLRCSLHWFNYDDLDIHVIEPKGNEIYYSNKNNIRTSGFLDIDMNAGSGKSRDAVENITWTNSSRMEEGVYELVVHNFCKRERIDEGFECEIECNGEIHKFSYSNSVKNNERVKVAKFSWSRKDGLKMISSINESEGTVKSVTEWNLDTNKYQKVSMIMLSPNYWDDNKVGNKHYFFILEGCKNPDPVRGFYNEYLNSELDKHKRVFEVLGGKMKSEYSDNQLSGLGFSSTKRDSLIARVKGDKYKLYKINF
jgi:hypothetical protein